MTWEGQQKNELTSQEKCVYRIGTETNCSRREQTIVVFLILTKCLYVRLLCQVSRMKYIMGYLCKLVVRNFTLGEKCWKHDRISAFTVLVIFLMHVNNRRMSHKQLSVIKFLFSGVCHMSSRWASVFHGRSSVVPSHISSGRCSFRFLPLFFCKKEHRFAIWPHEKNDTGRGEAAVKRSYTLVYIGEWWEAQKTVPVRFVLKNLMWQGHFFGLIV